MGVEGLQKKGLPPAHRHTGGTWSQERKGWSEASVTGRARLHRKEVAPA